MNWGQGKGAQERDTRSRAEHHDLRQHGCSCASLANLQTNMKGTRDTMIGGFSRGIKVAKLALENSMEDFRVNVEGQGRQPNGKKTSSTSGWRKDEMYAGMC